MLARRRGHFRSVGGPHGKTVARHHAGIVDRDVGLFPAVEAADVDQQRLVVGEAKLAPQARGAPAWPEFTQLDPQRNDLDVADAEALFFFQAEDGIRGLYVTGVQTCALPILRNTWIIYLGDRNNWPKGLLIPDKPTTSSDDEGKGGLCMQAITSR